MNENQNENIVTKSRKNKKRVARSKRIDSALRELRGIANWDDFTETILDKIESELDSIERIK